MALIRIATTRATDVQPLATGGQPAYASWSSLRAVLARELSPAHADLLAEPVVNPASGETHWYTDDSTGTVARLSALPAPAQQAMLATLAAQISAVAQLADRLAASGKDAETFLGKLLQLAVQYPGENFVYARGQQPVLVAWGHLDAGAAAPSVVLTGQGAGTPPPMVILPPPRAGSLAVRSANWGCLLAALPALLFLLAAGYVAWRDPLHLLDAGPAAVCRVNPQDLALLQQRQEAAARGMQLRAELAGLAGDAGARRLKCTPPPAAPPSDEQRAAQRGARHGKLEIILAWDDTNDLDLAVICPNGRDKIFFQSRRGCGGFLDIDANASPGPYVNTPVENISFEDPQPGTYKIIAMGWELGGKSYRAGASSAYRLTIKQAGKPDRVVRGVVSHNVREPGGMTVAATVEVGDP